jgi:hypothetical protein
MLIDASIHGPEAARGIRRWRTGVVIGVAASLVTWIVWFGSTELLDHAALVFLVASGLGLLGSALVFLGIRDYVAALRGSLGALPRLVFVAFAIDLVTSGLWLAVQGVDFATRSDLLHPEGFVSRVVTFVFVVVSPLATIASVVLFGRVASMIGARISPALAGGVVVAAVARLGLRTLRDLDVELWEGIGLVQSVLSLAGELLFWTLLTQHAQALAAHRPLTPGTIAFGSPRDEDGEQASEWEAPGRALARYRTAILAQMLLSLLSALLVLATRETPEQVGKIVSGTAILGLAVSVFLVVSVARYAASLPSLHATAPAKLAASLFALNALVGLVTTVLVVRAFSSDRLGLLFDLQDQLPVLEAVGTLFGLGGLLALLYSFDALGHELSERALPVRTRGLKVALVILVICALAAKLGVGVLGPLVAVFALIFAIGALFTVFSYLRVVGDVSALLLARAGVL